MNAKKLGDFFREHRLNAGLELDHAAELLAISSAKELGDYENGEAVLPLTTIFAMTNLYNVPPDTVMALLYGMSIGKEANYKESLS